MWQIVKITCPSSWVWLWRDLLEDESLVSQAAYSLADKTEANICEVRERKRSRRWYITKGSIRSQCHSISKERENKQARIPKKDFMEQAELKLTRWLVTVKRTKKEKHVRKEKNINEDTDASGSELVLPIPSRDQAEAGLIVAGTASPPFVKIHHCWDKSKEI